MCLMSHEISHNLPHTTHEISINHNYIFPLFCLCVSSPTEFVHVPEVDYRVFTSSIYSVYWATTSDAVIRIINAAVEIPTNRKCFGKSNLCIKNNKYLMCVVT